MVSCYDNVSLFILRCELYVRARWIAIFRDLAVEMAEEEN